MNSRPTTKEVLQKSGLRVTPHRVLVLTFLQKQRTPLSHKDILQKIGSADFDAVTLYRILDSFVAGRLARKILLDNDTALFEYNREGDDHHHLVCTECRTIVDIEGCGVQSLIKKALEKHRGFKEVTHHSFELFGLCIACSKK